MTHPSYTSCLSVEGRDLVAAALDDPQGPVLFRETEVAQVLGFLSRRRSVLLVGPEECGRTSVVRGLAAHLQAAADEHGPVQGLVEWPASRFVTGTRYLGEWQTKTDAVLTTAEEAGIVLYVPDVWNLATVGRSESNDDNVFDQIRPDVLSGRVLVLGEVTPEQLSRLQSTPGGGSLFEIVRVAPLSPDEARAVVRAHCERLGLAPEEGTLDVARDLCGRFLPRKPAPGPELRLLDQVRDYHSQKQSVGEDVPVDAALFIRVFSIYSGLPPFVVDASTTHALADVRSHFTQRIVGQSGAIEAVLETITLFKAGLSDPSKPIGSFLFVGPTGVGKTELARALAAFLFGSPHRLLRFDLSELKDYHAFEQLVGSTRAPDQPARLLDPVRTQPFQVVLFDELEKAHANVWDLLLPLLDEGHLSSPSGRGGTVDFRSTIVICTSNVGGLAGTTPDRAVGFAQPAADPGPAGGTGTAARSAREARTLAALEDAFRPEFLNRFQHVVVFHPLTAEDVRTIARHDLATIFAREGLIRRRLTVEVEDAALDLVSRFGFDPRYGARALKRELQHRIVLPVATTLMERPVAPGSVLRIVARDERIVVRVEDTPESRAAERETRPVALEDGRRVGREGMVTWVRRLCDALEDMTQRVDTPALRARYAELDTAAGDPAFWRDEARAARLTAERTHLRDTLDRLDQLDADLHEVGRALNRPQTREALERVGRALMEHERRLRDTWRELLVFGSDGAADALLLLTPVAGGSGALAVDFLASLYGRWAAARGLETEWLCEPRLPDEPALLSVSGYHPFGLLRGEAGLHRVRRDEDTHGAAVVRVLPFGPGTAPPGALRITERQAVKGTGRLGGALRGRLLVAGLPLLQNRYTLAENEMRARALLAAFAQATAGSTGAGPADDVTRRYDVEPLRYRDTLLAESSARKDCLAPAALHELLLRRAERLAGVAALAGLTP